MSRKIICEINRGKKGVKICENSDGEIEFSTTQNGFHWTTNIVNDDFLSIIQMCITDYKKTKKGKENCPTCREKSLTGWDDLRGENCPTCGGYIE